MLWVASLVTGAAQQAKLSPAWQSLANAERAFAKLSTEQGVRASFIANFAEDGINFAPGPVNTRETFNKRPAQTAPFPVTLNWTPVWGAVSAAGDLGFNTGPYIVTDNTPQKRPPQHGMFFSVWQRQPDGAWKVRVDIGINTPASVAPLDAPYHVVGTPKVVPAKAMAGDAEMQTVEREFLRAVQTGGAVKAYLNRSVAETRLHRADALPIVGPQALRTFLTAQKATLNFELLQSGLARSGDFGWTMGKYELKGAATETGHFVRVWQRDVKGAWRLLADVTNALPAAAK